MDITKNENNSFFIVGQNFNYLIDTKQAFDELPYETTLLNPRTFQFESKIGIGKNITQRFHADFIIELKTFRKDKRKNYNTRDFFTGIRFSKRILKS